MRLARTAFGWILSILLALVFIQVAWMKLSSRPNMVAEFNAVGLGQWFRYFTGVLELTGGIGILIPRVSRWAALLLVVVMCGATVAHLTRLHTPPTLPAVLLVLAALATWLRGPEAIFPARKR